MKKLYTIAAMAALGVVASSAVETSQLSDATMTHGVISPANVTKTAKTIGTKRSSFAFADPSAAVAPKKTIAKATTPSATEWKSLGDATFTDGLLYAAYGGAVFDPYKVAAYQSTTDENTYLLQDVYPQSYLDLTGIYEQTDGKESTCTITFTDPDKVLATFDTYLTDVSDGSKFTSTQRYYGTYAAGTISFGDQAYLVSYDGQPYNYSSAFDIVLPGALDVAVELTSLSGLCNSTNTLTFEVSAGADANGIRVYATQGIYSGTSGNYSFVAQYGSDIEAGSYKIDLSSDTGWNTLFAVSVTADGALGQGAQVYFYVAPEFNEAEWISLGEVDFTDDTFLPIYGVTDDMPAYKVPLYENKANPGEFAMIDAFSKHPLASNWTDHGHSHALYFTNTSEGTTIDLQPIGVYLDNISDVALESLSAGTIADGKLTFPSRGLAIYTADMQGYYANQQGRFALEIPDLLTVTVTAGGVPVADAFVNYSDWSGEGTFTDAEGKAYLAVPHGTTPEFMAYKDGYEMATYTATADGRYLTAHVELTEAEATLTLTVVNEEYEPVAGAWVTFMNQEYTTDEAGKLTVTGLKGTEVIGTEQPLTIYKDGYEFYEGTADYTETLDALKLVVLTEAQATLTVIVNDDQYEPIANAVVVFENQEYTTDESGKAIITDIPATTVIGKLVDVKVAAKGYTDWEGTADFTETMEAYLIVNLTQIGGIESIAIDGASADGKLYDLQGRRLSQGTNGTIVIMNGKKIHLSK